jgi:hypothetical protein
MRRNKRNPQAVQYVLKRHFPNPSPNARITFVDRPNAAHEVKEESLEVRPINNNSQIRHPIPLNFRTL